MADTVIPVPFRGTVLTLVDHEGEPFAAMRPIVEGIGLDWSGQLQKLNSDARRWNVGNISTVAADGITREMVCLPVRKLAAWLASINPAKVAPRLREAIEAYQAECDDALWQYWTAGRAERRAALPDAKAAPVVRAVDGVGSRLQLARWGADSTRIMLLAIDHVPADSPRTRSGFLSAAKRLAESVVSLIGELQAQEEADHGA